MECPICCNRFNRTTRARVPCQSSACESVVCKSCARTYLESRGEGAVCMSCKAPWDRVYLSQHLNASWLAKGYRQAETQRLIDKQKTLLIHAQPRARAETNFENAESALDRAIAGMEALDGYNRSAWPKPGDGANMDLYNAKVAEDRAWAMFRTAQHELAMIWQHGTATRGPPIIMRCPGQGCKGFINGQTGACGMCELKVCIHCFSELREGETHTCDPEAKASADQVKQCSKPCPSCAARISKIDGCDQMWCTECHVAFSWTSGAIETGHIHNPHYLEHQRRNGAQARAPGDMICGGLLGSDETAAVATMAGMIAVAREQESPGAIQMETLVDLEGQYGRRQGVALLLREAQSSPAAPDQRIARTLSGWKYVHKVLQHLHLWELPRLRAEQAGDNENEGLSVAFLRNKIDERELGRRLYVQSVERELQAEIIPVLEMLLNEGMALTRGLFRFADEELKLGTAPPLAGQYTYAALCELSQASDFLEKAEDHWMHLLRLVREQLIGLAKVYKKRVVCPIGDFRVGSFRMGHVCGRSKVSSRSS